jgi:hypothetical protein
MHIMFGAFLTKCGLFFLLSAAITASSLPFEASFPESPTPFEIDVASSFVDDTLQKVKLTRLPVDIDQPDMLDGPPVHNATAARDYWLTSYDWFAIQAKLNRESVIPPSGVNTE